MKNLKKQLMELKEGEDTLKKYVIDYVLKDIDGDDESIKRFFKDLAQHGCTSGMISPLIYYGDTHKFYNNYYDEIEEMRKNWEEETGEPLKIDGDLKNFFAWFAFEETARELATQYLSLNI